MSDASIQVVVAAFDTPVGASNMLKSLDVARAAGLVTIDDGAVLTRDGKGRLHIEEPDHSAHRSSPGPRSWWRSSISGGRRRWSSSSSRPGRSP
jgi:hypothetical protein